MNERIETQPKTHKKRQETNTKKQLQKQQNMYLVEIQRNETKRNATKALGIHRESETTKAEETKGNKARKDRNI